MLQEMPFHCCGSAGLCLCLNVMQTKRLKSGLEVVRSIVGVFAAHGVRTQCLAASIRSVQRVVRSFYNGAQVVTMPPAVFWKMYDHILTDAGLDIFEKDLLSEPEPIPGVITL